MYVIFKKALERVYLPTNQEKKWSNRNTDQVLITKDQQYIRELEITMIDFKSFKINLTSQCSNKSSPTH